MMEGILRTEVDTSWLEIRIERLLRFPVIAIKTMQLVIVYLERWKVTLWIDNLLFRRVCPYPCQPCSQRTFLDAP